MNRNIRVRFTLSLKVPFKDVLFFYIFFLFTFHKNVFVPKKKKKHVSFVDTSNIRLHAMHK